MICLELIKCKTFWKSANFLKETSMQQANYIFLWLISWVCVTNASTELKKKKTSKGLIKQNFKLQFDTIINLVIFRQLISYKIFFPRLEQENLLYPSVKKSNRGFSSSQMEIEMWL